MSDFIAFSHGEDYLSTHGQGLPSTCYFLLSATPVSGFTTGSTLGGGVGEISGTSYARDSQAAPTPSGGAINFSAMTWATTTHADWSSSVCSLVLATTSDNTGVAVCAWNLQTGGVAINMAATGVTVNATPSLTFSS